VWLSLGVTAGVAACVFAIAVETSADSLASAAPDFIQVLLVSVRKRKPRICGVFMELAGLEPTPLLGDPGDRLRRQRLARRPE